MTYKVTGEGVAVAVNKKPLQFSDINRLLSINMKTKVVQHVERE